MPDPLDDVVILKGRKNPLKMEEVNPSARAYFNFSGQRTNPDGRNGWRSEILRTCRDCGDQKWLSVSSVRTQMRLGKPVNGRCLKCSVTKPRVEKPKYLNAYDRNLRRRYGIGEEEYTEILNSQDGRCAICGSSVSGQDRQKHLSLDHNHITGKIRGVLCTECNHGLGKFGDSPELLREAAAYLEKTCQTH